jgi:hypothetical protein
MKTDRLKQYVALRDALTQEKTELQERLARIDRALDGEIPIPAKIDKTPSRAPAARVKRLKNKLSLKEAVRRATAAKPLTKPEILAAIKKLGYRFAAKEPINSLNVVLYSKRQFKNQSGKFSPAK